MGSKCRTINLAVTSLETIKECKVQGREVVLKEIGRCPKPANVPPSPAPVLKKKIMVCKARASKYDCGLSCPPCAPCPPCPTAAERLRYWLRQGAKLFLLSAATKWSIDSGVWGDQKSAATFTITLFHGSVSDETDHLPDLQRYKYYILHIWDKIVGNIFYYTFAFPLALITPGQEEEEIEPCGCSS